VRINDYKREGIMKVFNSVRVTLAVLVLVVSGSTLSGAAPPAPATVAALTHNVIVILRDQRLDLPPVRGSRASRAAALASAQAPIVAHLQASGAARIHGFALINAVAAKVSSAEAAALAAHPLVQAVVPERVIKLPRLAKPRVSALNAGAVQAASASAAGAAGAAAGGAPLCNTLEPEALQLLHAAYDDPTIPQAQRVRDGNGEWVTGKGVKVAWIADGMDPNIEGFIHTDGSKVFVDYEDFSGDPAGTVTSGDEAFGDASSIAANDTPNGVPLSFDISTFVDPKVATLPSPCNIRIRGMAPGASLVGLKAFSQLGYTTNTSLVQAIEYAVLTAGVDVINESFGSNDFPDNDNDPVSLADQFAVRAGVTVVVSSGDAGYNGTMGSPSTDQYVISAGATNSLRLYTQVGYGPSHFATNGWISNNLSALSSGGFSMSGPRTPDVVAPGDLGWALCSTDTALYADCVNGDTDVTPVAQPIEIFGGTSESSPLTAGTAALVIQAYRSTHGGNNPSPALVKQIIMSTASDLGAPASEQGAGLVNALAAVNAALSVGSENGWIWGGHFPATGTSLLNQPSSASVVDQPGRRESLSFQITNTGTVTQHLTPALEALGAPIAGNTTTVTLSASDPTFPSQAGLPRNYVKVPFTVPDGADHLDASIAWEAAFSPIEADFGLIDPSGHDMGYTLPQGDGSGYGHFDVNHPAAGTWTAIIWTSAVEETYYGKVAFTWAAERYVSAGSVAPATLDLPPGETRAINANFNMPSQPGDSGLAIRFASGGVEGQGAQYSEIPIALRTLIPLGPWGASFSGTLTGGNSRPITGPTQTYAFDVPPGVDNMSLALEVSNPAWLLEGLLIDPNGMQLSVGPDLEPNNNLAGAMQLDRANPQPGRWRFILLVNYYVSGLDTSLPFQAEIRLNAAQVSVGPPGLPQRLSLKAGPVTVPISVTNNSPLVKAYFADARLPGQTTRAFGTGLACGYTELPGACWYTYLPTQVQGVAFVAQASVPLTLDAFGDTGFLVGYTGAPDLSAQPVGPGTLAATLFVPEVPWGEWLMYPTLVGPFGPAGAQPTPVTTSVIAELSPFDASVSADTGDIWSDVTYGTATFTGGLVLGPGASGTINVTFTPNPALLGRNVRGDIYIDTFSAPVGTGDEVKRLSYNYYVTP
jgi:hypothetical protein